MNKKLVALFILTFYAGACTGRAVYIKAEQFRHQRL